MLRTTSARPRLPRQVFTQPHHISGPCPKPAADLRVHTRAEHLEPEDMVLKARVESLRKSVKDTSARVAALRKSAPELVKKQVHQSLEQVAASLEAALATSKTEQPAAAPKTPQTVSKAVGEAFVQDALDIASHSAVLHKTLPGQVPICVQLLFMAAAPRPELYSPHTSPACMPHLITRHARCWKECLHDVLTRWRRRDAVCR